MFTHFATPNKGVGNKFRQNMGILRFFHISCSIFMKGAFGCNWFRFENYVNQTKWIILYIWFYRFNYNWNTHSSFSLHFHFYSLVLLCYLCSIYVWLCSCQMIVLIMNIRIKTIVTPLENKRANKQANERKSNPKWWEKKYNLFKIPNDVSNFIFSFSLFFISYETLEGAYLAPVMAHKFICTN